MTLYAFFFIALSAILHASWNMLAKKGHITIPFYALLETCASLAWCHVLFWTPIEYSSLPMKFWVALVVTNMFDISYGIGISYAYSLVDMSVCYPVMRSLPILFTALVTSTLHLGTKILPLGYLGMFITFCGCIIMPLKNFGEFSLKRYMNKGMIFILCTALSITGYTVMDKVALEILKQHLASTGQEVAPNTISLSYYIVRSLLLCAALWLMTYFIRPFRQELKDIVRKRNLLPIPAGIMASLCYALVLIAMVHVTNVSYVQVFRQIGLPMGMFLGIVILKEKFTVTKLTGIVLILAGLVTIVI